MVCRSAHAEVVVPPSPWTARLGDSLNDSSYVFGEVAVTRDGKGCRKDNLNFLVRRSRKDESWDQIWLNIYQNTSWLSGWSWLEVFLSAMYIFWFTLWYKQGKAFLAFILTGIALWLFGNLTQVLRMVAPFNFSHYFGTVACSPGMVTLSAKLLKVHYETQLILLLAILAELGALGMMLRQIIKAIIQRKESSKSAVG